VDEDASEQAVVRGLRERGIDVVTTADAGHLGSTDSEQLAHAAEHGRTIYTFNVGDFARLHAQYQARGLSHAGITVVPDQRYSVGEKIRRVARLVRTSSAESLVDRIVYL
jgi:hypothetical protein